MARKLLPLIIAGLLLFAGALAMAPAAGAAPPPPSNCTIVSETFVEGNVGTLNTWFFLTTGCSTSEKPVRFRWSTGGSAGHGAVHPGRQLRRHHRRADHRGGVRVHDPGP